MTWKRFYIIGMLWWSPASSRPFEKTVMCSVLVFAVIVIVMVVVVDIDAYKYDSQ